MNISELRKRTGLSQSAFSKKFCLNIKTLQSWEQGVRNCPKYVLYMINRILELENNFKTNKSK